MARHREFLDYVAVSTGMALGGSCFAVTGGLFGEVAGPQVLVAVGVACAVCVVVSSSVADLARRYPSAPGIRTYLKDTLGDRASLVLFFMYLGMAVLAVGVESYVLSNLVRTFFPSADILLCTALPLAFIVAANLAGLEPSQSVQTAFTSLLIAGMIVLCGAAIFPAVWSGPIAWPAITFGREAWGGVPVAVGIAIFLYVGFEWVTPVGRSPRAYERLIPRSMLLALVILWVVYSFFVVALASRLDRGVVASSPIPHVLLTQAVFPGSAVFVVTTLSLLAMLTTVNAGLMGTSRLIYGVSREGYLPRWCSRLSLRTAAPIGAILALGVVGILASLAVGRSGAYLTVARVCAAINCLVYGALIVASLRLDLTRSPARLSPAARRLRWLVAALILALGVAAMVGPAAALLGFVGLTVASGILAEWSLILGRRRRRQSGVGLAMESP